jgi:hypothetical protein
MRARTAHIAIAVAVVVGPAVGAAGASAGDSGGASAPATNEVILRFGDRGSAVRQVQRRLTVRTTGYYGNLTERAVRRFQRKSELPVDGEVGPETREALSLAAFSRSSVKHAKVSVPRILRLIADCESGGNPRAVSRNGRYRGKYQFTRGTWRGIGGYGDPARAAEVTQDRLAVRLYRKQGTRPWPSCARTARAAMRRG